MTTGLTQRQADCLAFVRSYMAESGGVSPSFIEIADGLGLASVSGVYRLLTALEERGYLTWIRHRARSITLIGAAADPYDPTTLARQSTATLEALARDTATILAQRTTAAVLASPEGFCPAMEGRP